MYLLLKGSTRRLRVLGVSLCVPNMCSLDFSRVARVWEELAEGQAEEESGLEGRGSGF